MFAISAPLLVDGLRRTFEFSLLARGSAEEKNTLGTSMGAHDTYLADDHKILAACILGCFAMVWPAHVFLLWPPSS